MLNTTLYDFHYPLSINDQVYILPAFINFLGSPSKKNPFGSSANNSLIFSKSTAVPRETVLNHKSSRRTVSNDSSQAFCLRIASCFWRAFAVTSDHFHSPLLRPRDAVKFISRGLNWFTWNQETIINMGIRIFPLRHPLLLQFHEHLLLQLIE